MKVERNPAIEHLNKVLEGEQSPFLGSDPPIFEDNKIGFEKPEVDSTGEDIFLGAVVALGLGISILALVKSMEAARKIQQERNRPHQ